MPPNPLTLKQRLAALSANINSPSRSNSFDIPPESPITSKRKSFFKQPFGKSSSIQPEIPSGQYYGQERIQEVMSRLIFQAGVDYECVPISIPLPSLTVMFQGHDLCMCYESFVVAKRDKPFCSGSLCALLPCPTRGRFHMTFSLCESCTPSGGSPVMTPSQPYTILFGSLRCVPPLPRV